MQLPPAIQGLITGIRNNDMGSLMILIGIVVGILILVAIIVNLNASRKAKKAPPADWGAKSKRFKK